MPLCADTCDQVRCSTCLSRPHETLLDVLHAMHEMIRAIYQPVYERLFVLHESEKAHQELQEIGTHYCACLKTLYTDSEPEAEQDPPPTEGAEAEEFDEARVDITANPLGGVDPETWPEVACCWAMLAAPNFTSA